MKNRACVLKRDIFTFLSSRILYDIQSEGMNNCALNNNLKDRQTDRQNLQSKKNLHTEIEKKQLSRGKMRTENRNIYYSI